MLGDKIKVTLDNNTLLLENISKEDLNNSYIFVKNIFNNSLLSSPFELKSGDSKTLGLFDYTFKEHWKDEKIFVEVFSDNNLIFKKSFRDKTKCFVVISNKNYEKLAEQLIVGLTRYSNEDILHYTINYKSDIKYTYLTNIEFSIEGDTKDPQYMQFTKPPVFLDVLKLGYKHAVFLDADIQVRPNINDLFSYISEIEDGPVLHKSRWDFTLTNGVYIPGPLLQKTMDLPEQKAPQGVTNVVVFSKNHYELFEEWNKICFSQEINEIRKHEFLHDELILNCLMWKRNVKPKLFCLTLNVIDEKDIKFFYDYKNTDYCDEVDLNQYNLGHPFQSTFPYDKNKICAFHCIKDSELAKIANTLIMNSETGQSIKTYNIYENLQKNMDIVKEQNVTIHCNFIDGALVEIKNKEGNYDVEFYDDHKLVYKTTLSNNMWSRTSTKYFVPWKIKIRENSNLIFDYNFDLKDKRVYVHLDSSSLGDTIAWFPQLDEFRKKHNCQLVCSTFHNYLFEKSYPEIEFVTPGTVVYNLHAKYSVGWFYNENVVDDERNPNDFKNQNLQKTASDILGMEFKEVKPRLYFTPTKRPIEKKYICIANHSTAQAKYWNNPTGWQEVVDYLKNKGYEVVLLSKEKDGYMGNKNPKGVIKLENKKLTEIMNYIHHSEGFIGIGSGLSWLAWALNKKVFLISGFSKPNCEMEDCVRIFTPDPVKTCNGCFNDLRLDAGDWNWCPMYKNTDKMFECSKTITGNQVINKLEEYYNGGVG